MGKILTVKVKNKVILVNNFIIQNIKLIAINYRVNIIRRTIFINTRNINITLNKYCINIILNKIIRKNIFIRNFD